MSRSCCLHPLLNIVLCQVPPNPNYMNPHKIFVMQLLPPFEIFFLVPLNLLELYGVDRVFASVVTLLLPQYYRSAKNTYDLPHLVFHDYMLLLW